MRQSPPSVALIVAVTVVAGCGQREGLSCDINEASCRGEVYQTVLRVRGDAFDPFASMPPVDELTPDEFGASLRAGTPSESDEARRRSTALGLLRLIDPSATLLDASIDSAVNNVAAFYTPATKRVTIIKRARAADEQLGAMATLAHEFVHAIQDRELDLVRGAASVDEQWSRGALIEGDATLYELLAVADFLGIAEGRLGWDRYFNAYEKSLREQMITSKSRFFVARSMVYPLGGRYLADTFWAEGNAGIRRLYPSPPQTSVRYLHGPFGTPPPADFVPCVVVPAPGYAMSNEDVFGAAQVFAYLASGLSNERAWALARSWTGDRVRFYARAADGAVTVVWSLGLAAVGSIDDAELRRLAYAPNVRVDRRPDGLVVTASTDMATVGAWSCGDEPPSPAASSAPAARTSAAAALTQPPVLGTHDPGHPPSVLDLPSD